MVMAGQWESISIKKNGGRRQQGSELGLENGLLHCNRALHPKFLTNTVGEKKRGEKVEKLRKDGNCHEGGIAKQQEKRFLRGFF